MVKLGIDIGNATFKYIYLDQQDQVIKKGYYFHKGKPEVLYNKLMSEVQASAIDGEILLGLTGTLASSISGYEKYQVNNVVATVDGAIYRNQGIKSIIELGAQETKYITDIDGKANHNIKFFINSSCASGTGSFLEEQATKLSVNYDEISELISQAKTVPRIAGRCSVFSKTDMIHYQQEGVKVEDLLLGLCYSLVRNYKANVVQKSKINTPIMLTGGVIHNQGVLKAIKDIFKLEDKDIVIDEDFEYISCFGACKVAQDKQYRFKTNQACQRTKLCPKYREKSGLSPLNVFESSHLKKKHEVKNTKCREGYLGIDIGSISTNLVVVDEDKQVIDYIYTKTKGNPKKVVQEQYEILKKRLGEDFKIKGIGTTGSGRVLIGKLLGADFIVNEITAQAEGALSMDKEVDTIFEIGGQDSKYIHMEHGVVKDFEMNKICAAGTGAFIEEQVKKLGIQIEDFSQVALKGDNPSNLGNRCTVFIEGNMGKEIANGESVENISAGLAYSIVSNYLNRVVGNRKIGDKIFIQGGIAHNQAVINAFKVILNKEIIVPSFFSVSGALGVAVLTKKHIQSKVHVSLVDDTTKQIQEEGARLFLEGYTGEIEGAKKTIGIPRVLFMNKLFPMFNLVFSKLGYNVIVSDASNEEIIKLSQEHSFEETCYPVKLINGHVAWLLDKGVDYIFMPHLHTMKHIGSTVREDYACVYMQTSPKIIESIFDLKDKGVELIAPDLSFNFGKKYMIKTLITMGKQLGKSIPETTVAVMAGMKRLLDYEKALEKIGEKVIKDLKDEEKVFVIVSRVYNLVDPVLNMGIENYLKGMGYKVLHLAHLEASEMKLKEEYNNMYWPFGQHILTGASIIRNKKNLYPIYITNHGCGPDTVLAHYFKKEMEGKPYLHIEVDEHSSKVGVMTRVEAFVNALDNYKFIEAKKESSKEIEKVAIEKDRTVLIPSLGIYSHILKAFIEKNGRRVEILEEVNEVSIEEGKKLSETKEYFSLIAAIGQVLHKVSGNKEAYTLYYPTTEGGEVFGQYGKTIQDKVLELKQEIDLEAPFIEDFLGDPALGVLFATAIIGGDLIELLSPKKKEWYLGKLIEGIEKGQIDEACLIQLGMEVKKEFKKNRSQKRLLVMGEPLVIYQDYLNNGKFKELEQNHQVIKQPLAESLYMFWDDFANKTNQVNKAYIPLLKQVKTKIELVNQVLGDDSPYNANLGELSDVLKDKLAFYAGGLGRYRLAKLLTYKQASGIIIASSMYENTATILKIIRGKYEDQLDMPILDLYFDSNISGNNDERLATFVNYLS